MKKALVLALCAVCLTAAILVLYNYGGMPESRIGRPITQTAPAAPRPPFPPFVRKPM